MALDADPSVIYAEQLTDVFGEPSSRRSGGEIPYNTYRFAGLPPGRLRIREKRAGSGYAPDRTNFLYLSATEWHHRFARTWKNTTGM